MKTWSYGVNSIYKQVSIYLEEASWWVFVVDKIVESLDGFERFLEDVRVLFKEARRLITSQEGHQSSPR